MMNSSHRGVWRCMRKRGVAIRPKGEGKMRRSLIKILVLALILSVMLTALNYEPRANYDPEEKRLACIINYGFNYWTGVRNGAEEAGEDDNVSIDVYSFELMDTQRQIQLMKKMEYMKVDGIITMGDPNNKELNNEIARLSEEGIPVALIDSDSPQSKRACYIGSDNYAIGQQAAKVLAEKTEESAKIIVMVSKMEYANQQERYQGFADEIAKYKDMQILAVVEGDSRRETVLRQLQSTLDEFEDADTIFCAEGNSPLHVGDVLKQMDKKMTVLAMENSKTVQNFIKEGIYIGTLQQNAGQIGYQAVKMLEEYCENPDKEPCEVYVDATYEDRADFTE